MVADGADVDSKINAAAGLMTTGQFAECIEAYRVIAEQHPEKLGICEAQIGAAYYFLGDYQTAIRYYQQAKGHGANPDHMDDNIAEAREALGQSA